MNGRWAALVAATVLVAAGCGSGGRGAGASAAGSVTTTTQAGPTIDWEEISAPSDCMCSDGSPFRFLVHQADPTKVLFFLQGGGACFDQDGCAPDSENFTHRLGSTLAELAPPEKGIFDPDAAENPFRGYSIVYVPYCTGDVHIGNAITDYGGGVVIHHVGFRNVSAALAELGDRFPGATDLVVAGVSAGSVASPLYAGMAADVLDDAAITVLADGSGGYPDIPVVNSVIGAKWGSMDALPDWPEIAGMTVDRWSLPGLFVNAGRHDPAIRFARHDFAFDETQTFFAGLAGIDASHLDQLMDRNEAEIEAGGVPLASFIEPGFRHTVLESDRFYRQTLAGTRFVDWVAQFVMGGTVPDVHCTDCGAPKPTTTTAPTATTTTP